MFIFQNLNIEAKRRKLSLICESSEAKRTWLFPKIKLAKRSELVYFKNWQYPSEANRFDSDFVFKKTKKSELSFFFKTKGKKWKGLLVNYRSFAITTTFRQWQIRIFYPISSIFPFIIYSWWRSIELRNSNLNFFFLLYEQKKTIYISK